MMKNKSYKIVLLVDNPQRDLLGMVLLAIELVTRGHKCFLVPMNLRHQEIWNLSPDFVLLNHARPIYKTYIEELTDSGIKIGILDTEGAIYEEHSGKHLQEIGLIKDDKIRDMISSYCMWSEPSLELALKNGWYKAKQLSVTGCPRYDLYSLVKNFSENNEKPKKILITTNLALANPLIQNAEKEKRFLIEEFDFEKLYVEKLHDSQMIVLKSLPDDIKKLAKRFPDECFVLRPHPFENDEYYKDVFKGISNIVIENSGSIFEALKKAKCLINWGSSTVIDAVLYDIPALNITWYKMENPVKQFNDLSMNCKNLNEIEKLLYDIIDDKFSFPEYIVENKEKIIKEVFFTLDGNSHIRVADTIITALNRDDVNVEKKKLLANHKKYSTWPKRVGGKKWEESSKFFDDLIVRDAVREINKMITSNDPETITINIVNKDNCLIENDMKSLILEKVFEGEFPLK